MVLQTSVALLGSALEEFYGGIAAAAPRLVSAVVFLALAAVSIWAIVWLTRVVLSRLLPAEEHLVVDLAAVVVGLFLCFGAALALLKILGMGEIAASLGTAAGFVALGVSYALSNMISDTVAGVYLLRDPDFEAGDAVEVGKETGVVTDIGLRKSRLRTADGEVVVLANGDVDEGWTKLPPEAVATDEGAGGESAGAE
ncbi:MAG: mechanosensitive ion channel domain-containing protein [Halobacteriaceae archaeon]